MLNKQARRLLRYGALLVPTLFLSFINIGKVQGDTAEKRHYYTPSKITANNPVNDEYKANNIYLIDFKKFEFTPKLVQIHHNDALLQEEELAEEEQLMLYEIDLGRKPEGLYKIIISDKLGHVVTETFTHKTT